jgi:MerR family transcriptional regulator, redox-sensitive transcriptional activator SoxR
MKIGELAARAGLNASAIRYYEKSGLLDATHRVSGQRRYPEEAVYRVLLICFASDMGFSVRSKSFSMVCVETRRSGRAGESSLIERLKR